MIFPCSTELGSGVVSTTAQCGSSICPSETLELDDPVVITIEHTDTVRVRIVDGCHASLLRCTKFKKHVPFKEAEYKICVLLPFLTQLQSLQVYTFARIFRGYYGCTDL